jgi:peptidoglycan/xylan/chitin deacetylase (PgdA/CDA1 family)
MPPAAVFKAEQRRDKHRPMISRRSFFAAALALPIAAQERRPFRWPAGKRAAISLTFDDARVSQIDAGIPLLERCGVKATFYVSPSAMPRTPPTACGLTPWRESQGTFKPSIV